jgi:sugar phosphate isomerase/epimerase
MIRRKFIANALTLSSGLSAVTMFPSLDRLLPDSPGQRKFKVCLNPFAIGVQAGMNEMLDMAIDYGFEAIIGIPQELIKMSAGQMREFNGKMEAHNISWGASFLPVEFRTSSEKFREDLNQLPNLAMALQNAGLTKTGTWIMPTHDQLTYLDNFELHVKRLKETARILGHFGIKLGLEYVGPKTLMARDRHPFIGSMAETKELLAAIDEPNTGFILDSFHWYCAGETPADILSLHKDDIIAVDLNDARAGVSRDDQIDNMRELPTHSGVIHLADFIKALNQIGYDGTIRAEPFNQVLNEMNDERALEVTAAAMFRAAAL